MKRKFFIFFIILILTFGQSSMIYAEELNNGILITTIDNSEAIKLFKNKISGDSLMLSRHGFGANSIIGTPFSMEYQSKVEEYDCLFYFPIITNGKIVSYVEQTVLDDGTVSWAVSNWFDLEPLRDGNAYSLISDDYRNRIAVSDKRIVSLNINEGHPMDYTTPYMNVKTKVVDITKPLDGINPSELNILNDEEQKMFENARANGKKVSRLSLSDADVINKNDRILVPLRDLTEFIGCNVSWDANTRTAYVSKDGCIVSFKANSTNYTINNSTYNMDVPAEIFNSKTYVPLRTVGEALGMDVIYNEKNHTVTLSY